MVTRQPENWFAHLRQQHGVVGFYLLAVLILFQIVQLVWNGEGLIPVLAYATAGIALALCAVPSWRFQHECLRQQIAIVVTALALATQVWSSLAALQWSAVLVGACFAICAARRAAILAGLILVVLLAIAISHHSGFQLVSFSLVPLLVLLVLFIHASRAEKALGALEQSLTTDSQTGCVNLRGLQNEIVRQAELCQRYDINCTALVLCVENWQSLSQNLGERKANAWLKELTSVWSSRLRNTDVLCRYRDSDFVLLLPNTASGDAANLAEDLLRASLAYDFQSASQPELSYRSVGYEKNMGVDEWLNRFREKNTSI